MWKDMSSAPKDGSVIDVWLEGSLTDIEFYCQQPPIGILGNIWGGRSAGWHFLNGKFRPYMRGLGMPVFIQPTMWAEILGPPNDRIVIFR